MNSLISYLKKGKNTVGIEIGVCSIKMVELAHRASGPELVGYCIRSVPDQPSDAASEGDKKLSAVLRDVVSCCSVKTPRIYFSISGPSVSLQRVSMPVMPDKEIPHALQWTAKKQFPFSLKDARITFQKTDDTLDEKKQELLVAAAQKSYIESRLSLFKKAGVSPYGIHTVPNAHQHATRFSNAQLQNKTTAILDIGSEQTKLSILRNGALNFARDINTGSNDFTKTFMEPFAIGDRHFALDFNEAEKIKQDYGIPLGGAAGETAQGIPLSRIMVMLRPVLEKLITETLRSFDYYKAHTRHKAIDHVYICGGGAGLHNLTEFLSGGLGVQVSLLNPFEHISISPEIGDDEFFLNNRHQFATAAGLAIGCARECNLMPARPGGLETTDLTKWIPAFAAIIFIMILYTLYADTLRKVNSMREQIDSRTRELMSLNVSVEEITRLGEKKSSLMQTMERYPDVSLHQPDYARILLYITKLFPDSITVERLFLTCGQRRRAAPETGKRIFFNIEGFAAGKDYEILRLLTQKTDELLDSPYFSSAMLDSTEKKRSFGLSGIHFMLKAELDSEAYI